MSEEKSTPLFWEQWLKAADRELSNADRRWRYHNKSFDAMGDKTVERESVSHYVASEDLIAEKCETSFVEEIRSPKLKVAVLRLSPKQQTVLELLFWEGYTQEQAARILNCHQSNISKLLRRAFDALLDALAK